MYSRYPQLAPSVFHPSKMLVTSQPQLVATNATHSNGDVRSYSLWDESDEVYGEVVPEKWFEGPFSGASSASGLCFAFTSVFCICSIRGVCVASN